MTIQPLTTRELATILAALRHYQESGLADCPELRSDAVHDIATEGGTNISSMCGAEINALCERLNFEFNLLSAAPDLLAACKAMRMSAIFNSKKAAQAAFAGLAAIEKAEGRK